MLSPQSRNVITPVHCLTCGDEADDGDRDDDAESDGDG
jgi:hypothetical protein